MKIDNKLDKSSNKVHKNTDQITSGIYSILSIPLVFDTYQKLIGSDDFMKRYVREFICPFPDARILDIGCGTAPVLKYLPTNIEYVGYDLNPHYIEDASKKYKGRGKFYCERISDSSITKINDFDIALAGGVLHHIDDDEAKKLFEIALHLLKPGGYLITYDGVYIEKQSIFAKWILSKDRGKHVRTHDEYVNLAKSSFSKTESFIMHDMYKMPYTAIIMKCSKAFV